MFLKKLKKYFLKISAWKLKPLPLAYTLVEQIVKVEKKSIKTPLFSPQTELASYTIETALKTETDWVNTVESALSMDSLKNLNVSWSSFHAHTTPMIFHAMNICKEVTNYLNKGQTVALRSI